jgi:hypothetical protein
MNTVECYYRDNVEYTYKEWMTYLQEDIDAENPSWHFDITDSVMSDLNAGYGVDVNEHDYCILTERIFSSAVEAVDYITQSASPVEIVAALLDFKEEEAKIFLSKFNGVTFNKDNTFTLEDERER